MNYQIARSFSFDIRQRNALLFNLGVAEFFLVVVLFGVMPFDQRDVQGISPWFKPIKFAVSFGLYLVTMSYLVEYLIIPSKVKTWICRAIALLMSLEISVIILQGLCETPYHFSLSTPLSAKICYNMALFILGNFFITANSMVAAYVFYLFFKKTVSLPAPYLWGIRIGMGLFLLSCLQGVFIAFHNAHIDNIQVYGSYGLPFISPIVHGDLRSSHFLGVHALQVIPFLGYFCKNLPYGKALITALGAVYFGLFITLFVQAV
jgi:hypothetical protein